MDSVLNVVLGDLRDVLSPPLSEAVLILISIICGATVGLERQQHGKPAGLRTLMLICLGSTIFTLISMAPAFGAGDPSRIAAQIVTGVGFLGAGAIIRERGTIVGLTTAASIWVVAAIGMVVGAGYGGSALLLAIVVPVTLNLLGKIEMRRDRRRTDFDRPRSHSGEHAAEKSANNKPDTSD